MFVIANTIQSQSVINMNDAAAQDIEKNYTSAVNESENLLFSSEEEKSKMNAAYQSFINDLGIYLAGKKFKWTRAVKCSSKLLINGEGRIDYFIFDFIQNGPSEADQTKFKTLVGEFIKTNKFKYRTGDHFVYTNTIKFLPR